MNKEHEHEMAPEIYIFTSKDSPGIKFIDRSPTGAVAKFAGSNPEGKFIIPSSSIEIVSWNDEINIPNKSINVRYMEGPQEIHTKMVSEAAFKTILYDIYKQMEEGKTNIVINENWIINNIDNHGNDIDDRDNNVEIIDKFKEIKNQLDNLKNIDINYKDSKKDFSIPYVDDSTVENMNDSSDFGESSFKI